MHSDSDGLTRPAAIITAQGVSKHYDGVLAVDSVSFEVRAGECFGLLGPNGAGKTSIIRMLYGFSPVSSGSLRVFGLEMASAWRQIRSRLGVCQQDNTLDPDLSVVQNLLVFAGYFGIAGRVARQRAEELLTFFALEKKAEAKVGELSGGLARRLTLARALINDPKLIILDEPTTGLDPQSRHLLWERLRLLRGRGKTFLLTTHYMEEAAQLCDRLVIMDHGRILVEGAPAELIRRHVGERLIELRGDLPSMRAFLKERALAFDDLGDRLVLEDNGAGELERAVRQAGRCEQCTVRAPSLEDVFLRLTGRELRE